MPATCRHALAFALAIAACLLVGTAQATVSGSCVYKNRTVTFVDGAAWQLPAEEENKDEDGGHDDDDQEDGTAPAGPPLALAFTTVIIDAGALARAKDRSDNLHDQVWGQDGDSGRLLLTVEGSRVSRQDFWMSPGSSASYSGSKLGHYTPAPAATGKAAGSYRFTPDDGQDITCNVEFNLTLLGDAATAPPPRGTPLPAHGGAPGAAYLAMNKALHSGDFEAMARLMPASRATEVAEMRNSPDRAAHHEMARALSPTKVRITGGRQHGDSAWVEFSALESGTPRVGTAEMKREGTVWYLVRESTRDPE